MPTHLQSWLLDRLAAREGQPRSYLDDAYAEPIEMNTGAPPFVASEAAKQAAIAAVERTEYLSYASPGIGLPALRALIARGARQRGLRIDEGDVLVTYGCMQAMSLTLNSILDSGDQALLPAPFWFAFTQILDRTRGQTHIIETSPDDNFRLTPERLERAITPASKVLVLTNPNNPNGKVYTRDELAALVEVLDAHPDIIVVADEIYDRLSFELDTTSIGSFESIADRSVTLSSTSKNFAMSGQRTGWILAPKAVRDRYDLATALSRNTTGVQEWLQRSCMATLAGAPRILARIHPELDKRRQAGLAELRAILPELTFPEPEAAYFVFCNVEAFLGTQTPGDDGLPIDTDEQLAEYLLDTVNVHVVPGTTCGISGWFRLTFAIKSEDFAEGVRRMRVAFDELETRSPPEHD